MIEIEYYTSDEFAKIMRRHKRTIRSWIYGGVIKGAIKVKGKWLIPTSEKKRIIEEGKIKTDSLIYDL